MNNLIEKIKHKDKLTSLRVYKNLISQFDHNKLKVSQKHSSYLNWIIDFWLK